jgi:hypothetical protein
MPSIVWHTRCKSLLRRTKGAPMPRRAAAKREMIDTGTDKRYVRRDAKGQFKESDDVGRSLKSDRRTAAKTRTKKGQGDRGDR